MDWLEVLITASSVDRIPVSTTLTYGSSKQLKEQHLIEMYLTMRCLYPKLGALPNSDS